MLGLEMGLLFRNPMGLGSRMVSYFCPALAKAMKTMKKGEKVILTIKPQYESYGFGEAGRPAIGDEGTVPPNATLEITLKLVLKTTLKEGEGCERHNDGVVVNVKLVGKLPDSTIFTKKGNDDEPFEFKTDEVIERLDRAVKNMRKGEVALVTIRPEYAFGSTESAQDLAVVPANLTVHYKVELVSFAKVLDLDSRNVKALYRRAQAYIQLVDLDLAELDIKKALEIDPDNRDVKLETGAGADDH
ncbi:hypothetical protein C1H46_016365 [Malus baccata]|uniref:peptidylprolyl isomerase n=1 Tax=Malus baccata TaxID=106549 RepID=A0A540MH24_MALBA|nr:hypothetical protein C1H46_016365 [Malus baccata]